MVACAEASGSGAVAPGYEYLSPMPGSRLVSPWNNVVLRPQVAVDVAEIGAALTVAGSRSGPHRGRLVVSDDARTLVFTPDLPFTENEPGTVTRTPSRGRDSGVAPLAYSFSITPRDPRHGPVYVEDQTTGRLVRRDRLMAEASEAHAPESEASRFSSSTARA